MNIGLASIPEDVFERALLAMAESKGHDEEGPQPALYELIGFSGENKTRIALRAALRSALLEMEQSSYVICRQPRTVRI